MYAHESGRRLSEWQAVGGLSGLHQEGSQIVKNAFGGATWSFGGLPGTGIPHQDQFRPTRHQEIPRQSPQGYVLKQHYLTPRQERMRGQHGNPTIISSEDSWPWEEFQPSRPPQKRAGSPSVKYEGQIKRQQSYSSSGLMRLLRPVPENSRQIFSGSDQQDYGSHHVNEVHVYPQEATRRVSLSPYEQAHQGRSYHERPLQKQSSDPQQHFSPYRAQPRMSPASYSSSQEEQFRVRSLPQVPLHPHSSQPMLHSPSQCPAPQPLQHGVTCEQSRERHPAQSQHHQTDLDIADHRYFGQAMTAAPEEFRPHQNQDENRSFSGYSASEIFEIEKPRPQLRSPLWPDTKVIQNDAPEPANVLVYGHFVEPAGNRPVPEDQIDRGGSNIPFTPPRQRAKTLSVSSQCSLIQRGRGKSVAPPTLVHEPQKMPREKSSYYLSSMGNVPNGDSPDGTSLNELLGEQQRQGHMSRNNFDEGSYRAASVLPQDSIFSYGRPKAKPPISQGAASRKFPTSPPDAISLISTPDSSGGSLPRPAVRSVPMKERVTPAKKPPAKISPAVAKSANLPNKSTPKTPKKQKAKTAEDESLDPAIMRQKRAADLIITKEIKGADEALDLVLFGEVIGQTQEEKQRMENEMRTDSQRKRMAKETELQARKEAEELVEMENLKILAEKDEKERFEKEREEDRKRVRREAERKRREALEECERDELRRKAAEKIEADRKKVDEEAEEHERLKQEAKDRAERVQAEAEDLAKLKAKREEAKKQAASLSAAKVPAPNDDRSRGNIDKYEDVVVIEEEDTLFLPEKPPEPTSTPERTKVQSVNPSSAAEVFAQSGPKAGISAYRAEKEEAELRRARLAKESRLNERWKKQEAAKAVQQAPPPPRSEPTRQRPRTSKAPKKERPPPKPRTTCVISPPSSDTGSPATSFASQPVQLICNIVRTNSSSSSTKSDPAVLPPKPPQQYKSTVKLVSQLEREKLEREQHAKRIKENALKKAAKTEQQKAERRKKEDEKARVRKKQQLIDEANENGVKLSEADLLGQVEEYMVDREAKRQRRVENQFRKDKILDFAPDNLALESLMRPQNQSPADTHELIGCNEELTLEDLGRRANEAAMKESMRALALQRGGAFARAAAKKTVADLQSDSESEEDPDDEPPGVDWRKVGSDNSDGDPQLNGSETYDDEANVIKGLNPDNQNFQIVPPPSPNLSSLSERRNRSKKQQPEISSLVRDLMENPSRSEHEVLMLYTVYKEVISNGKESKAIVLSQFLSHKEANDFAATKTQECRQTPTKSISEGINDDGLYCATVVYDRDDKNQAYFYVTECSISSGDVADFDAEKVDNRWPEKTFLVIQFISQRKFDEETGETHIHHNEPEILGHFSRLEMANHEACTRLITLLKPKSPRIEYIEQYENEISKVLREQRDVADQSRKMFDVNIGPDQDQLQWITFLNVRMAVQLFEMKGPRN